MGVSVPSRGLCFQSQSEHQTITVTIEGTFPSPLGDCVFNLALDEYNDCWIFEFPSPLGDCVFNLVRGGCNYEKESSFRPLSGIVFSIKLKPQRFTHPYRSFRPLSGIVFSIGVQFVDERPVDVQVSVPSRGLCFQSKPDGVIYTQIGLVSVPSRGLCFQSRVNNNAIVIIAVAFPSPLGDCVFNRGPPLYPVQACVSVPSRGLCFQSHCQIDASVQIYR